MSSPGSPGSVPRRLLVRSVNWLGDAVMSAPALQRLRERYPEARLAILAPENLASLWASQKCLDSVLTFAAGESPFAVARRLREYRFDAALLFPNSTRSALEVWAAGIGRRAGYKGRWRSWLLTEVVSARAGQVPMRKRSAAEIKTLIRAANTSPRLATSERDCVHQSHHYLHLAAALGAADEPMAPALCLPEEQKAAAREKCLGATARESRSLYIAVNPSAAYGPAKRWPVANFAAAIRRVQDARPDVNWISFGTRADAQECEQVASLAGVPILNLAGKTTLSELMAMLSACRILLTNDSGPMHLAAALGTPVVAIFGSTSPELTGPGLPGDNRHRVIGSDAVCAPCFRRTCPIDFRCMHGISPERVASAVLELLNAQGNGQAPAPPTLAPCFK